MTDEVRRGSWDSLEPRLLHDLVQLRADVFVVEQACSYRDLDGRDVEPGTEHVWTSDEVGPTAYLRVLDDGACVRRIGRVCTRADARGQGLAAALMRDVVTRHGSSALVLEAQSHLSGWYARFGFLPAGAHYVEDGIPHTPMRRSAQARAVTSSPSGTRGPV